MKIVVLDDICANPGDISWDALYALGDVKIYDRTPRELLLERIGDAEIILVNKIKMGAEIFSQCPNLRYIGVLATGYNIIDTAAAADYSITVCNVPAYSTPSVVQHTFALLLELCMRTGLHSETVKQGKWHKCPDFCYWDAPLTELSGKTMGLVGFGQIGTAVARVALCFGMNVLACASKPRDSSGIDGVQLVSFQELIEKSDIISLHCPQTPDNYNMISAQSIASMKDGVILLNTARGGLINEADLAKALKSGKVGGFGADVLANEPPLESCPLINAPNTVITPHIAWAPLESRTRLINVSIENVRLFIEGRAQNTVN